MPIYTIKIRPKKDEKLKTLEIIEPSYGEAELYAKKLINVKKGGIVESIIRKSENVKALT